MSHHNPKLHLRKETFGTVAGEVSTDSKKTLYINNLYPTATEYSILKLMKPYGEIVGHEFKWHEGGTKKFLPNYCTVTYADAAGAQRARDALHGLMPRGVFKPLSVVFLPMKTGRVSETMTGVKKDGDEDDNDPLFDEFDDAGGRPGTNRAEEAERLALTAEKLDNKIGEVRAMLQELEEEEKSLEA